MSRKAFAAALYITGLEEEAAQVLEGFKWGHNFLEMNDAYLDRYQSCANSDEVREMEEEIKPGFLSISYIEYNFIN